MGTYIPPTCDEEGYTLYTCSRCSDSFESDHIESLGHSLEYDHTVDPTCTEQGYDVYICSECGQEIYTNYIPELGHFWRLSPHGGSRICVRCGASDTVTPIDPPIGPIETKGTGDANEEQEGDTEVSDVVDSNEDEQSQPEAGVDELNETEDSTAGEEEQEERTIVASYDYIYAGDKLLQETVTSDNTTEVHQFFYDNNGTLYALMIDNTVYYYITNLQGDVVGLIDESGNIQATYSYDPYGKVLSATGPLADRNPLRYRGYYYDSETRFYYVSSRYYDPEICRWISADDVSYIGAGGDVLSYNLFAYCLNDPINRIDENGNWSLPNWAKIAIGTVALGVAIALTVATGEGALGVVSILQTVVFCTAVSADVGYLVNGEQGAIDGMCDGYMFSSISSLGSAALGYISSPANGIDEYYNLRKTNRGTGLQVHHIVEKRFADLFNIGNKNKMLGIAVSKSEHQVFTNAWRRVLPYGGEYSRFQVIIGIVRVYYKLPKLLVSVFRTLI